LLVLEIRNKNTISTVTHHQNCDINIYEGIKTQGTPEFVIFGEKTMPKIQY